MNWQLFADYGRRTSATVAHVKRRKVEIIIAKQRKVEGDQLGMSLTLKKLPLSLDGLPEIFVSSKGMSSAVSERHHFCYLLQIETHFNRSRSDLGPAFLFGIAKAHHS